MAFNDVFCSFLANKYDQPHVYLYFFLANILSFLRFNCLINSPKFSGMLHSFNNKYNFHKTSKPISQQLLIE
jgi:hypothetical protein